MVFHEITPQAIAHALDPDPRHRRQPRERPGGAPHPRPARRLRRLEGALARARRRALGGPGPVRRGAPRRRARARAHRVSVRDLVGDRRDAWREPARASTPGSPSSTARASRTGRTSTSTGRSRDRPRRASSRRATRRSWPPGSSARRSPSPRSPPHRAPSAPGRRSSRRPCRSRARASSAGRRTGRCAWPRSSTRQGWITYMRTDSTTLSGEAIDAARSAARTLYGPEYVPDAPRRYDKKVRNAQEAHEAIRPAGLDVPLDRGRVACPRVATARGSTSSSGSARSPPRWSTRGSWASRSASTGALSRDAGAVRSGRPVALRATGQRVVFPGFRRAYVEGSDDPDAGARRPRAPAARARRGLERSTSSEVSATSHETKPPARFTEATLVRRLEELGIGRPSTYASVVKVIKDRDYVWKKGTALIPSYTAFAVTNLWSATTPSSSTTGSPRRWRTTSTRSRTARRTSTRGCAPSTSATRQARPSSRGSGCAERPGARSTSTFPRSTRSRSAATTRASTWSSASAATARRSSAARSAGRCPPRPSPTPSASSARSSCSPRGSGDIEVGHRPGERPHRRRPPGPLRALRPARDDRAGRGAAEDRVAVPGMTPATITLDEALALLSLPRELGARRGGQRGDRAQRPLRPVSQGRHRDAVAARRAVAVHRHPGRGARAVRPAEDPGATGRGGTAARARRRPGVGQADDAPQGPLRPVRHRRRDQRLAAHGRRPGLDLDRAGRRAPPGPPRPRPARRVRRGRVASKKTTKKATAKKAAAKTTAAKTTAAKKTTTKRATATRAKAPPVGARRRRRTWTTRATRRRRRDCPRGRFVAFEGVDGCGKSTQVRRVASSLGRARRLRAGGHRARRVAARRRARRHGVDDAARRGARDGGGSRPARRPGHRAGARVGPRRRLRPLLAARRSRTRASGAASTSTTCGACVEVATERARAGPHDPPRLPARGRQRPARRPCRRRRPLRVARTPRSPLASARASSSSLRRRPRGASSTRRQPSGDVDRDVDAALDDVLAMTDTAQSALFEGVVGQDRAVARSCARRSRAPSTPICSSVRRARRRRPRPPASPQGSCARTAAAGRATAAVARCAACTPTSRRVHRTGAAITVDEIRDVTTRALRRPVEGVRQVLVIDDVHLAVRSAPALLKTLEEPPATTVFILTAEDVPPGLVDRREQVRDDHVRRARRGRGR